MAQVEKSLEHFVLIPREPRCAGKLVTICQMVWALSRRFDQMVPIATIYIGTEASYTTVPPDGI